MKKIFILLICLTLTVLCVACASRVPERSDNIGDSKQQENAPEIVVSPDVPASSNIASNSGNAMSNDAALDSEDAMSNDAALDSEDAISNDAALDSEDAILNDAALDSEDTPLNSADIVFPNVQLNFLHIESFPEYQKFMQSDEGSNIQISYEDIKGLGEFGSFTIPGALLDDYSEYRYRLIDKNGFEFMLKIKHAYSESFSTIDSLRPMDPNQADLREIEKASAKGFQYRQVGDWIYRYYSAGGFADISWTVGQTQFSIAPFLIDLKTIAVEEQTGFLALFDQKRAIQTQQEMLKKCPVLQAKSKDSGIS